MQNTQDPIYSQIGGLRQIVDESVTLDAAARKVFTSVALTANRTLTLMSAAKAGPGTRLRISDPNGAVSATATLSVAVAGTDTINGLTANQVLNAPYGEMELMSDGTSKWEARILYGPQLPALIAPLANFKNLIDGGDFTVNPFQRNIPGLAAAGVIAAAITNTPTYFADRFFGVGAAASAILFSKVADTSIPGFNNSLKFQRQAANANLAVINMGQVMETADSIRCQGQQVTLSFWAKKGANYSGGNLSVQLFTGTGTNDTAANMVAGAWAGSATPINATQALTAGFVRYQFTGTVAATATQLGVLFGYTPTGAAGADDSVSFHGIQLEIGPTATTFEHRDVQVELEICQRYAWVTPEPAAGVILGSGMNTTAAIQIFYMATPVQLYKAPTVTVSAGTFKTNQASVATATAITAGATHTPNAISVNGNSAGTQGQATLLQGGGGTGYIVASSDF